MHTLFIAFISFVSYATGVVTVQRWGSKRSSGAVRPLELLLAMATVSCGIFLSRPHYSLIYLALCSIGMLLFGAGIGSVMLLSNKHAAAGTREFEMASGDDANLSIWRRWLNSSRAVVDYEFRLLLLACYVIVIGPFAFVFQLGRKRNASEGITSAWLPRSEDFSPESARRPF